MMLSQLVTRQQNRQQHDQQGPQVGNQADFGRRPVSQSREVQKMVAEYATDPVQPDLGWLAGEKPGLATDQRPDESQATADGKT